MSGIRIIYSRKVSQQLAADVDIATSTPYHTEITAYTSPISLAAQNQSGCVLEIWNNSGEFILINSDIELQGAATDQLRINSNQTALLMYLLSEDVTERYRVIGNMTGLTLQ